MKAIKTKILSFAKKLKELPKKYLIIGSVVLVLVLGGAGLLIWRLSGDTSPESNVSNQQTAHKSGSQDDAGSTATDDRSTTNPDDPVASDGDVANGSSNNSSSSKKSGGSSTSAATPQPDTSKPTAPTGFTVSNGPGVSRIMDWDASSDNVGVAGYYIYRMMFPNETPTQLIDTITDGSTDDTEGDEPGLFCNHAGTVTYYAIRAFDAAGNLSDWAKASIPDEEWVNCTPIGT